MLNNIKVNDRVYHFRDKNFRNLSIKKIYENYVLCDGEELRKGEWLKLKNEKFFKAELFTTDNENIKPLNIKNKWNRILEITDSMSMRLIDLYERYLTDILDLNPIYQRDFVWNDRQKIEYIMAIFTRQIETRPTLILNYFPEKREGLKEMEVLDGKQRLTTLFDFIEDKFALDDGRYFSDLSNEDRKIILNHNIRYTRIAKLNMIDLTDKEKVELFLEINELGTKMSDEHIKEIKEKFLK